MAKAIGESRRRLAGLAMLGFLLSGCGVSDGLDRLQETIDESFEESQPSASTTGAAVDSSPRNEWTEYVNQTGFFTVDLPAEPEYVEAEQDNLLIGAWSTEAESNGYEIAEYSPQPGRTYDFDLGVMGSVEGAVNSIEEQLDKPADFEVVDQSPTVRNGHVGVRFVAAVTVEGGTYGTVHGAVFDTDEGVVVLTMIDTGGDDTDDAERFIESLKFTS